MHALLQGVPIFLGLNRSALEFLAGQTRQSTLSAGQFIVREGEPGTKFFIIGTGVVEVFKHAPSGEFKLARLRDGDFFGEMCILENLPRAANVRTVQETSLFHLSRVAFEMLYDTMPDQHSILVSTMARSLSARLRKLEDEVILANKSPAHR